MVLLVFVPPVVKRTVDIDNGMELHCVYSRILLLSATLRWWNSRLRYYVEKLLNSFVMHRHTGPASGIQVWGGIRFHCPTPLVRMADTLNSQRTISDELKTAVIPYI
ncbi:hypothetical protein TNCV_1424421 [Trichonephila clavipes]|nr:hypothetical protein TNCV_1424421 [Trichonephila clavipes]